MTVSFDVCPVRFVDPDVRELVRRFKLADERLTLSEQERLPPDYLEACEFVADCLRDVRAEALEKIGK